MRTTQTFLGILGRDLLRHPGNALATVASMAAGVAVCVGILQAGSAARSSFVSTVEAVAGRATHQVMATSGVDEGRLPAFVELDGVEAAQPIVEGLVRVVKARRNNTVLDTPTPPLRLLGIDPFLSPPFLSATEGQPVIKTDDFDRFLMEPGTVVLPAPWANDTGVEVGDTLVIAAAGRSVDLRVLSIYALDNLGEAARDTAVVDIATAQEVLDRIGRLDRIDLIVGSRAAPGNAPTSTMISAVEACLRSDERLERPRTRGERVAKMVDAFRLNLLALSSLAIVVGALLVFNAAQFSVVRRGGLLGQLRCLGLPRSAVVVGVVAEVAVLGVVAGIIGVTAGSLLAHQLAQSVARTITDLYAFVRVDVDAVGPALAAVTVLGTAIVAGAAGLFPALDAARTVPRMVGIRSRGEIRFRGQLPRLFLFTAGGVILGALTLSIPGGPWLGFVAALAFLVAGATSVPPLMALVLPLLRRLGETVGHVRFSIACGAVERSLARTGGAAAALGVSLSMTLAVIVMIASFEREVTRWIEATLLADLYIADSSPPASREPGRIPDEAIAEIERMPGIRAIDTLRSVEVPYADRSILFTGASLSAERSAKRFEFIEGDRADAVTRALGGDAIISEPLSNRYDLHVGDFLVVRGRAGEERFEIAGVFRDFSYDRGYAFTGAPRFVAAFGEPGIRNVAIYVESGVSPMELATSLRERFANRFLLEIRSNAEVRGRVLMIFHRTFEMTYALQFIATLIALAGIAVTLAGLFIERSREIATLRAVGASVGDIGRLFGLESVLLALFPVLLALPLGALLAWVLIDFVNLRSFGWTIGYTWPSTTVALTCALAVAAGLLASLVPLALAYRQSITQALREE